MFLFSMFRGTPFIYVFVFNVSWDTLYLCFCFQCFVGQGVSLFLFLMFRGTPCIYVFCFQCFVGHPVSMFLFLMLMLRFQQIWKLGSVILRGLWRLPDRALNLALPLLHSGSPTVPLNLEQMIVVSIVFI